MLLVTQHYLVNKLVGTENEVEQLDKLTITKEKIQYTQDSPVNEDRKAPAINLNLISSNDPIASKDVLFDIGVDKQQETKTTDLMAEGAWNVEAERES
jgi:hypothetical protein